MTTVGESLERALRRLRAAGSESARLDAEVLLAHALGTDRTAVLAHPDAPVGEGPRSRFEADVERRAKGEPVAYIRGIKEFYGLAFAVDARALIPRPETERLVELGLARAVERLTSAPRPLGTPPLRLLDLGTGSGAVAVTLAVLLRRRRFDGHVRLVASDASPDALALAVENAVGHGVADLIEFRAGDLLDETVLGDVRYDVIVANLPYIPSAQVPTLPVAASFEPAAALDGGPDGLALIRRGLQRLPEAVTEGGSALFEIGADQAAAVRDAVRELLPAWSVVVHPDLSGAPRVAEVRARAEVRP